MAVGIPGTFQGMFAFQQLRGKKRQLPRKGKQKGDENAPPSLRQVLKDRLRLVLLDPLGHHIEDIVHNGRTKLEVEVRVNPLLRNCLRDTLRVTSLELTREEVTEPAFEEGNDTAEEEEPDAPSGSPETDTGTLTDGTGVEAGVDL
jgi:hypothetical protein